MVSLKIQSVVGAKTYGVWTAMLRELGPDGRTHRLSILIAGMLEYATRMENRQVSKKEKRSATAKFLSEAAGDPYDEESIAALIKIVQNFLKDSGVRYRRVNSRGKPYSIADAAVREFLNWEAMPWEA